VDDVAVATDVAPVLFYATIETQPKPIAARD
jgi:hypothetical protein